MQTQILDAAAMRRSLNRITFEILERNHGANGLTLVGVRRRGAVLARRIAEKILELEAVAVPCVELDVSSYRDDREDATRENLLFDAPIAGRHIVLVDDVLFTGRTVRAAIDAIFAAGRAEDIQLAVLIDRGHRELPFRPDYIGKNLPTARSERVHVLVDEIDGAEGVTLEKGENP